MMTAVIAGCSAGSAASASVPSAAASETAASVSGMTAGTYEETVSGHNGDVHVSVTLSEDGITDIQIGDNSETLGLGTKAMDLVRGRILKANSTDVDTVAGATISSAVLKSAVNNAISEAGGDPASLTANAEEAVKYEDTKTQVVVVGSGSAGLAAALQAHQNGNDVILLEQLGLLGGSSLRAGYYIGGDTKVEEAAGDIFTADDFTNLLVTSNPDQTEEAEILGKRAGDSINWVYDMGMTDVYYDAVSVYGKGLHWGKDAGIGAYAVSAMQNEMDEEGIDYRVDSRVTSLINEDGRVTGVNVETKDGQKYSITADAVILATGGFAANDDMAKEYTPELTGLTYDASKGADGSGMLMAEDAGAALDNMSDVINYYGINVIYNGVPRNITYPYLMNGMVIVNNAGRRFINETAYYLKDTVDAMRAQDNEETYIILSKDMLDAVCVPAHDYSSNKEVMYTECASVDETAEKFGIDASGLKETLETYNSYVDGGEDKDFGNIAVASGNKYDLNGPFYVAKVAPCRHMNYGGIRTDLDQHVLTADNEVIPGLYAAGECTHIMLNGIGTNTISLVQGRVAADTVSSELN